MLLFCLALFSGFLVSPPPPPPPRKTSFFADPVLFAGVSSIFVPYLEIGLLDFSWGVFSIDVSCDFSLRCFGVFLGHLVSVPAWPSISGISIFVVTSGFFISLDVSSDSALGKI